MARIRTAFVSGTTLNNPLAIGDTSLSSSGLSSLATITSPDIAAVVLDPAGVNGTPEVVWVTAHTAAATTATISRAAEGSTARAHPVGTAWVHGSTIYDIRGTMPEFWGPLSYPDTSMANNTLVANQAYLWPLQPLTEDVTATTIIGSITVQSGNIDAGIYSFDGTTLTRVVSTGSTACPATGANKVYNIADTVCYRGTRYFVAFAADNITATFRGINGSGAFVPNVSYTKAASFPLPATISSPSAGTFIPMLLVSVSGGVAI